MSLVFLMEMDPLFGAEPRGDVVALCVVNGLYISGLMDNLGFGTLIIIESIVAGTLIPVVATVRKYVDR